MEWNRTALHDCHDSEIIRGGGGVKAAWGAEFPQVVSTSRKKSDLNRLV